MTLEQLLPRLLRALDGAGVTYMLTGSVASSAHGEPRSTRDLDIVIAVGRKEILDLLVFFPNTDYYADEQQALAALASCSQFNVIDFATGWKVDFIIAESSEYARLAMSRRKPMNIAGHTVYVASAEDVLIAKLRWAKVGRSDRQLQDATGILTTQSTSLDIHYVERWVRELALDGQWESIRAKS